MLAGTSGLIKSGAKMRPAMAVMATVMMAVQSGVVITLLAMRSTCLAFNAAERRFPGVAAACSLRATGSLHSSLDDAQSGM